MAKPVQIVGVLNVTPDSFHDGGRYQSVESAVVQAKKMIADGADIIEIGGESTGPKSADVSVEDELKRVLPVLDAVRKEVPDAALSIDTYKSAVATEAIKRGVLMVNDVTAGRGDPDFLSLVASSDVQLVLMYAKDPTPRTTIRDDHYDDVVATVKTFLQERVQAAVSVGVDQSRIILDPGLGHFLSSDARYSLEMIARLSELSALGFPLFLSPSRKSFLAGSENLKTLDRLPGTLAASAIAVLNGADYIRTHDVLEVRRACETAELMREYVKN